MTALCGGGNSAPKAGVSAVTLLASGFLAVALQRYGAGWLQWAIPFLALPELTLSSFCATDPPAIPTFTAAESKALVDVTLGADFNSGLSKFGDLVQHLVWYDLCQCTSGALTALPAAPAPPAGTPVYSPPPANGVLPTYCQFLPGGFGGIGGGSSSNTTVFTAGLNPTMVSYEFQWSNAGAGPHPQQAYTISFSVPGLAGAQGLRTYTPAVGVYNTVSVPVPFGATSCTIGVSAPVPNTDTALYVAYAYCNGSLPGVPPAPCCPADPTLQLQVDTILRMVTLLQRQLVPFAYISSTAHAGLTAQGSIAVQGLLGVRIDLTTLPATYRQDSSSPPFIFDVGWVSMQDANGFIDETRAHAQHQNWFSRIASDATVIGYSFAPGIVATVTELQREP